MRRVLYILAALVFVIGLWQFAFPNWWMERINEWAYARWFALFGLPALAFGLLVTLGALMHLMALRRFFIVLGLLTFISGGVLLVNPDLMRDLMHAVYLNRAAGFQLFVTRVAGLVRLGIALVMAYAIIKAPHRGPAPPPGPVDA